EIRAALDEIERHMVLSCEGSSLVPERAGTEARVQYDRPPRREDRTRAAEELPVDPFGDVIGVSARPRSIVHSSRRLDAQEAFPRSIRVDDRRARHRAYQLGNRALSGCDDASHRNHGGLEKS